VQEYLQEPGVRSQNQTGFNASSINVEMQAPNYYLLATIVAINLRLI